MSEKDQLSNITIKGDNLFDRVISIIEQAKENVVKAVNSNMVIAYWLIGREIVNDIQKGDDRAEYGKQVMENLSKELTGKFGKGFSVTNLWYFRQFYIVYSDRKPKITHLLSGELRVTEILHQTGGERQNDSLLSKPHNADGDRNLQILADSRGFSPLVSWTHYRNLMSISSQYERLFYEMEVEKERWSVVFLKRQINTYLFARLLKSKDKEKLLKLTQKCHLIPKPSDLIKNPYILDFLGLPESNILNENDFEQAIIDNIQSFLLELGKGFAFVARQKRVTTESKEFYIDLVFYNYYLKCFVLVDLKCGELSHQDIGQMDMYVRLYDDLFRTDSDNPTVGLILCREKDRTIVKYSVLRESKQLFASKYMMYLPTEEELIKELEDVSHRIEETQAAYVCHKKF